MVTGAILQDSGSSDTTPPSTPSNLTATTVSSSQINLTWTASTDNVGVTGYQIYRGGSLLTTVTGTSYSNTGLTASTAYSYYVQATDAAGNVSANSNTASATTQAGGSTKFAINDRVQVSGSGGGLNVRATPSTSGTLLATQPDGALGTVIGGPTAANGFNWWNINFDTGADGWSVEDYLVKVTGDTTAPSTPANLAATAVSSSQINLSWTASTDNVGVTGYKIFRGGTQVGTSATNSYNDTGLTASTAYSYYVQATDAAGNVSANSNTASATTQAGTSVPTATLSANPTSITSGQSSTLTWSSTNATSCSGTGFTASGTSGSVSVSPASTQTYSITCTGAGGTSPAASATVTVTTGGSTCPKGTAYADGCAGAPSGTGQLPSILNAYGANRPGWSVPGVEYYVGVPTNITLKDPATLSMSGVSISGHTITITGNNVTLDGYDFSLGGGWGIITRAANTRIVNSNFLVGSNNIQPIVGSSAATNLYIGNCTIDGAGRDYTSEDGGGSLITMGTGGNGSGITVEYSWLKNGGDDVVDASGQGPIVLRYNLMTNSGMISGAHGDYLQAVGGPFDASLLFNTIYHTNGTSQGLMLEPDFGSSPGSITGGVYGNNVIIAAGSNMAYEIGITVPDIINTVTVHDTYFVPTYGLSPGGIRGGPDDGYPKTIWTHNVNMVTGAIEQDSGSGDTTPPSTPANLSASAVSSSQINLTWAASTDNVGVTGYKIFRGGTQVGTSATNSLSNTGLNPSTAYSYTVQATDAAGNVSGNSNTASATTQAGGSSKFSINDRVQVFGSGGGLNVRATPSTSGTLLARQPDGALGTVIGGPTAANGYNWWNINFDTGADGWSVEDYLVKVTGDTTPPSTPANLTASAVSPSQINLSWTASTDNVGVTGYRVFRNGTQVGTATTNSYSDTGVTASTAYSYTVQATDAAGNVSANSNTASATTQAGTSVPTATLSANPTSITSGQSSTLTWTSTNATSCTGNGFTASGTSGSTSVSPASTQTYSVTCTGTGGTSPAASATVTVTTGGGGGGTYSIFTTQAPTTAYTDGASTNYELGTKFQSTTAGQVTAIRYKASQESGTHTGHIWSSTGTLLATVTFSGETASGWETQNLTTPLSISAGTTYTVSVNTAGTYYVATNGGLASAITNGPLSTVVGGNGTYGNVGVYPTNTWQTSNYYRDVVFTSGGGSTDTTPPSVPAGLTATAVSSSQINLIPLP